MGLHLRARMLRDAPPPFSGTVEIDETYIDGMWHNKPLSVRRRGTKRGHGTSKQAILGVYHRQTKTVVVVLVPNLQGRTLLAIIERQVRPRSTIRIDAYGTYVPLQKRYRHRIVNHSAGEYARGQVHTNGIESFWGYLKRRLKTTGGIRRERLPLYAAEEVWRFNHRQLSREEQVNKLRDLLVAEL